MKKLVLVAIAILCITGIYAQEKTAKEYKAEGVAAYKVKDYATAYTAFDKALELNMKENVVDTPLHYNAAYCSYKIKNYEDASRLFEKSIELEYRKEKAYQFAANSNKKLKNNDKYSELLVAGLANYPDNPKLKKMKATLVFRNGLGHYNKASENIQAAALIVESDPEGFKVKKAEAEREYKEALPLLEEAYSLHPTIKNLPEALIGVYEGLDMKDKAEALKAEVAARK